MKKTLVLSMVMFLMSVSAVAGHWYVGASAGLLGIANPGTDGDYPLLEYKHENTLLTGLKGGYEFAGGFIVEAEYQMGADYTQEEFFELMEPLDPVKNCYDFSQKTLLVKLGYGYSFLDTFKLNGFLGLGTTTIERVFTTNGIFYDLNLNRVNEVTDSTDGIIFQPSVRASFRVFKGLSLDADCGYQFSRLTFDKENPFGDPIEVIYDTSGLFLTVGTSWHFD